MKKPHLITLIIGAVTCGILAGTFAGCGKGTTKKEILEKSKKVVTEQEVGKVPIIDNVRDTVGSFDKNVYQNPLFGFQMDISSTWIVEENATNATQAEMDNSLNLAGTLTVFRAQSNNGKTISISVQKQEEEQIQQPEGAYYELAGIALEKELSHRTDISNPLFERILQPINGKDWLGFLWTAEQIDGNGYIACAMCMIRNGGWDCKVSTTAIETTREAASESALESLKNLDIIK